MIDIGMDPRIDLSPPFLIPSICSMPLANVINDPILSGPEELEKVDSSVIAGLINTQQHQIITDATFS